MASCKRYKVTQVTFKTSSFFQPNSIFEPMKKILIAFSIITTASLISLDANAQCPMCKASVESGMEGEDAKGKGLNDGILYLLATPYLAIAVVGTAWYYKRKK